MSDSLKELEAIIFAARNYVVPSDDLRPRTLESARDYVSEQHALQRLRNFVAAIACLIVLALPMADRLVDFPIPSGPDSSQMYQQATKYASDNHIGNHWAMVEAFSRVRQVQADPNLFLSDL